MLQIYLMHNQLIITFLNIKKDRSAFAPAKLFSMVFCLQQSIEGMCELNPYILIAQPVYSDIHSNLVTIPLETDCSVPYGLVYANEPTAAVNKFLNAIS